jgi:hypothetical protein
MNIHPLVEWSTGSTGPNESDMLYRSYTDGPQGAKFELLIEPHHTPYDLQAAKSFLMRSFDAVEVKFVTDIN